MSAEYEQIAPYMVVDDLEGVRRFFTAMLDAGIGFHPEETASEVGQAVGPDHPRFGEANRWTLTQTKGTRWLPVFTPGEATLLDAAMERVYTVCEDATCPAPGCNGEGEVPSTAELNLGSPIRCDYCNGTGSPDPNAISYEVFERHQRGCQTLSNYRPFPHGCVTALAAWKVGHSVREGFLSRRFSGDAQGLAEALRDTIAGCVEANVTDPDWELAEDLMNQRGKAG